MSVDNSVEVRIEQVERIVLPMGFRPIELPGVEQLVYAKVACVTGRRVSVRVYCPFLSDGFQFSNKFDVRMFWKLDARVIREVGRELRVWRIDGWDEVLCDYLAAFRMGPPAVVVSEGGEDSVVEIWRECEKCGRPMWWNARYHDKAKGVSVPCHKKYWSCAGWPKCEARAEA